MKDRITILFVDDDYDLYFIYNKLLNETLTIKFDFIHSPNIEDMLEKIKTQKFDIVVLDQRLNDGNKGLDFLPNIKQGNIYSYVIINSGYGSESLAIEAIRKGADDYVKGNKENNEEFLITIEKAITTVNRLDLMDNLVNNVIDANKKNKKSSKEKVKNIRNKIKGMK